MCIIIMLSLYERIKRLAIKRLITGAKKVSFTGVCLFASERNNSKVVDEFRWNFLEGAVCE